MKIKRKKRKNIGRTICMFLVASLLLTACGEGGREPSKADKDYEEGPEPAAKVGLGNVEQETMEDTPDLLGYLYEEENYHYSIRVLAAQNSAAGAGWKSLEPTEEGISSVHCEVIYVTHDTEGLDYTGSAEIFDLLIGRCNRELFTTGAKMTGTSVETLDTIMVNGVEMTKFEGELIMYDDFFEEEFTYPVAAYGIAARSTPVLVCCIDRTEDKSRHSYWVDMIDQVAATFRETE